MCFLFRFWFFVSIFFFSSIWLNNSLTFQQNHSRFHVRLLVSQGDSFFHTVTVQLKRTFLCIKTCNVHGIWGATERNMAEQSGRTSQRPHVNHCVTAHLSFPSCINVVSCFSLFANTDSFKAQTLNKSVVGEALWQSHFLELEFSCIFLNLNLSKAE